MKKIYESLSEELKEKFSNIKLILLDFDGVLTNNLVIHDQEGKESVMRSRADSLAIDLLSDEGYYNKEDYQKENHEIDLIILSRESNLVVKSVAEKIKLKYLQSTYKKFEDFQKEVKKRNLDYSQVLFIGNDLNDLDCIQKAGIGVAVADSSEKILNNADYVTHSFGGKGAFREICELIIHSKQKIN